MAQLHLNFGLGPDSHTGESDYSGFSKIETNFTEIYGLLGTLPSFATQTYVGQQVVSALPAVGVGFLYGGSGVAGQAQQVTPSGLLQLVSGNLALGPITSFTLLANATGSSAAPTATSLSTMIDAAIGSTRGGVLFRGASGWTYMAPGTSGYVFQTNGTGADPTWAPQVGGGGTVPVTTVATSGTSQALSFAAAGSKAYDVTLTGNCAFTITGGAANQDQTLKLWVRAGAGGFTPSFPNTVVWRGGTAPSAALGSGALLTISFSTPDGGTTIEGVF